MKLIIVVILGFLFGYFLNICIYNILKGKSILYLPSCCPRCESKYESFNLIPILSYIFNKSKHRYSREGIFLQYPVVELLNGLIYLSLYLKFGLTLYFFGYAILSSLLIVISFIDFKLQIIPDKLNLLCLGVGVVFTIVNLNKAVFINSTLGLLIGGSLFLLIAIITKGAMGGGDIKLMGALGFCLGWRYILLISVLSFVIGAIISIFLLIFKIKGRKDYIPFGPFISIGALITILYGSELIQMYVRV